MFELNIAWFSFCIYVYCKLVLMLGVLTGDDGDTPMMKPENSGVEAWNKLWWYVDVLRGSQCVAVFLYFPVIVCCTINVVTCPVNL